MREIPSEYGRVAAATQDELFHEAVRLVNEAHSQHDTREPFVWALTGGGTPITFYKWCVGQNALSLPLLRDTHFTVSDERCVPLASSESNFGNAERHLLNPLSVPTNQRHPWDTARPTDEAVAAYTANLHALSKSGRAYDLCFLGMGDDCHTASLFPQTPLLKDDAGARFGAQEVPGKGWRLTITPTGLKACGHIVVMTLGASKAEALHRIHRGPHAPHEVPSQILKTCANRVTWLIDEAAARLL